MPRPVVEDYRNDCLDICELRRSGLLSGKRCKIQGAIRWPKVTTMIVDPTCIQITLTNGQKQIISLSWAQEFPTTKRPWLLCPSCGSVAPDCSEKWQVIIADGAWDFGTPPKRSALVRDSANAWPSSALRSTASHGSMRTPAHHHSKTTRRQAQTAILQTAGSHR